MKADAIYHHDIWLIDNVKWKASWYFSDDKSWSLKNNEKKEIRRFEFEILQNNLIERSLVFTKLKNFKVRRNINSNYSKINGISKIRFKDINIEFNLKKEEENEIYEAVSNYFKYLWEIFVDTKDELNEDQIILKNQLTGFLIPR